MKNSVILSLLLAATASPVASRLAAPTEEIARVLVIEGIEQNQYKNYMKVDDNLKCKEHARNGRMFKNLETQTIEDCYERCNSLQSCNFFTFWEEKSMCIGCTLEGAEELVEDKRFTAYEIVSPKPPSDFGYELWKGPDGKSGIGHKCPFKKNGKDHPDRIIKHQKTTRDDCYHKCLKDDECSWFSWGEAEVAKDEWEGNCMLCREDDELQYHEGFNFWTVLSEEDTTPLGVEMTPLGDEESEEYAEIEETAAPTPSPTEEEIDTVTEPECPADIELVAHDGKIMCHSNPIRIISQDTTSVTVEVIQTCTPSNSDVDFVYWQYASSLFDEVCEGEGDMSGGESTTITMACKRSNQEAVMTLWVADTPSKGLLVEGDKAKVSKCCQADLSEDMAVTRSVYAIKCVTTC